MSMKTQQMTTMDLPHLNPLQRQDEQRVDQQLLPQLPWIIPNLLQDLLQETIDRTVVWLLQLWIELPLVVYLLQVDLVDRKMQMRGDIASVIMFRMGI